MNMIKRLLVPLFILLAVAQGDLFAADVDCTMCHDAPAKKKYVHAALRMGCAACHANVDAKNIPHTFKGKAPKGLSSAPPRLCVGCHDKSLFTKKNKHAALRTGCSSCHDPHSSDRPGLLLSEQPDMCFTCHDGAAFTGGKSVHVPVSGGMCSSCHDPHSSSNDGLVRSGVPDLCFGCHDNNAFKGAVEHVPVTIGYCLSCHAPHRSKREKLLVKDVPGLCYSCHDRKIFSQKAAHVPVESGMCLTCHAPHVSKRKGLLTKRLLPLCLDCHPDVVKKPHVIAGFSKKGGHPLGTVRKRKKNMLMDPLRKGEEFSCVSCHAPHGSEWARLFRYKALAAMELCVYCHKF